LSPERLAPYLIACGNDLDRSIRLYEWNGAVSGAFFEVLSDVEVIVRNSIHQTMSRWSIESGYGSNWYDNLHGMFDASALRDIAKVEARLGRRGVKVTPEVLVAELGFGFWRFLLAKRYETTLWAVGLWRAFPNSPLRHTEQLFQRVGRLHHLRNRVAHHEPIFMRRLELDLNDAYMTIKSVCTDAESWTRGRSRVEKLLETRPI